MYQFRLTDKEKQMIREQLSTELDKIDNNDQVDDMDSYLDGFCFQLDPSIIAQKADTNEMIVQSESILNVKKEQNTSVTSDVDMRDLSENALDCNDLDIYTMQFFQ